MPTPAAPELTAHGKPDAHAFLRTCPGCGTLPFQLEMRLRTTGENSCQVYCRKCWKPGSAIPVGIGRNAAEARAHWIQQLNDPLRVVGFDPGLAKLGVFVLELEKTAIRCVYRDTFRTVAEFSDGLRYDLISDYLEATLLTWRPALCAFEAQHGTAVGKEQRGKGNADRLKLQVVTGMIRHACRVRRLPLYDVATATAAVALFGKGKSRGKTKQQRMERLKQILGLGKLTLDEADAGAVALGGWAKHLAAVRR